MVMVVYQLAEIRSQLKDGFHASERRSDNMDMKMDLMSKAISDLQQWQAAIEARDKTRAEADHAVNSRWVPIGIAVASALVVVFTSLAHP